MVCTNDGGRKKEQAKKERKEYNGKEGGGRKIKSDFITEKENKEENKRKWEREKKE